MALGYERCLDEITEQTEALAAAIDGADLTVQVPSCPGWTVGQLLRHVGGGMRWIEESTRSRSTGPAPADFRDLSSYTDENPAVVGPWLTESAALLVDALRDAGPDGQVWAPVPGGGSAFIARRFAHETAIHRADAVLALGQKFTLADDFAIDGIDEWMELASLPVMFDIHPEKRVLLGPGRTLHLHATDNDAEWVLDFTGETFAWRRAHEKSAVALRGPVLDLLLTIYQRIPADRVEILGDRDLLDLIWQNSGFGS
jgi:uncharacterized protein (TIGR03083 family)